MNRLVLLRASLGAAALLSLCACPPTGAVCGTGLTACTVAGEDAKVCVDTARDIANCGACGTLCGEGSFCSAGQCECAPGFTLCGDRCVDLDTSASSCGACGRSCGAEQACDQGQCVVSCPAEKTQCGQSCVELATSEAHCGACGNTCQNGTTCNDGRCEYDVVVGCYTGQLVGIQAGTDLLGPATNVGTLPLSLGILGDAVLVGDNDHTLYQARKDTLAQLAEETTVGEDARSILVEDPFVYVINAGTGTLQILESVSGGAADGGTGYVLQLRSETPMNVEGNSNPHDLTKLGDIVYVSLHGVYTASPEQGQKIARFDVSDPTKPVRLEPVDLMGLDLKPNEGATTVPRPSGIVARGGRIYVALVNAEGYSAAGAPLVARFNPADGGLDALDLDKARCLGPSELAVVGDRLLVSCAGRVEYEQVPPYRATVTASGVLALDREDAVTSTWSLECPKDADGGCEPPVAGRLAVHGDDVYVGSANQGRMFVLELDGGSLAERRGFRTTAGPLDACPPGPFGFTNVGDVVANP